MASNFWTSPQAKALVSREQLRQAHAADRAAGLSDRQLDDLHAHFAAYMQQLARSMATESEPLLRQRVVGTAAIYFRKLYLRQSFCGADPRHMAPACLFLASKTEETPIHSKLLLHYARRLCTKQGALPPPDLPQLVTAEAVLLEQLDGDLLVFSPYPSLSKFLQDSGLAATNKKACEAAWSILNDSYRTPLHLLHPPHVLALGALCLAATITQLDLGPWLEGLTANFGKAHEVASEMLAFYEWHATPISAAVAQQHLDRLGLPAMAAPPPQQAAPQRGQQQWPGQQQGQQQQQGQPQGRPLQHSTSAEAEAFEPPLAQLLASPLH